MKIFLSRSGLAGLRRRRIRPTLLQQNKKLSGAALDMPDTGKYINAG